jgi:protein-S-isoprenylcysteine O-methyltransferase Ste14
MYLAVLATIAGQALLFGRLVLVLYAAGVAAAFVVFVRVYEEPALDRQFGADYGLPARRSRLVAAAAYGRIRWTSPNSCQR